MKFLPIERGKINICLMKSFAKHILKKIVAFLARHTIKKFTPRIIAVTGSVGKTSSKEAICAVLKDFKRVRKSSANFNNELGVPLTILGSWSSLWKPAFFFWCWVCVISFVRLIFGSRKKYPEVLVLEYGADSPGDIGALVDIAKPNIGVISSIGALPVHVENYPLGIDSVVKEKSKIISSLGTADVAILNNDDPQTSRLASKTRARVVTFGFLESSDTQLSQVHHVVRERDIEGISCKISVGGSTIPLMIQDAFSISHLYAAACGVSVGQVMGINGVEAVQAITKYYTPLSGRSVLVRGIKNTYIIDESYNSSPIAVETALATLRGIKGFRKIAILGDMLELGDFAIQAHEAIGALVPESLDILITVGLRAKFIAQEAQKRGMKKDAIYVCETAQQVGAIIQNIIKEGDLILIKGSRKIGLDAVVEEVRSL